MTQKLGKLIKLFLNKSTIFSAYLKLMNMWMMGECIAMCIVSTFRCLTIKLQFGK